MDIKALRKGKGWTQAELAAKLGTDHVTVSRWERGVSVPRPAATRRLKEVFSGAFAPGSALPFIEDPTRRLRRLDRMRREQLELKRKTTVHGWTR